MIKVERLVKLQEELNKLNIDVLIKGIGNKRESLLCKDKFGELVIPENVLQKAIFLKEWKIINRIRYATNKHEYFLSALKEMNPDIINNSKIISEYSSLEKYIYLENDYGIVNIKPRVLLQTKKVGTISYIDQERYFLMKVKELYSDFYDYSEVKYIDATTKIIIICPIHGRFRRVPSMHLHGSGCQKCARENTNKSSIKYNITLAERNKESWINIPATVYKIDLKSQRESFSKIGITKRSIKQRFNGRLPYEITKVNEIKVDLYEATYIEKILLEEYKQYVPKRKFGGHTECICKE